MNDVIGMVGYNLESESMQKPFSEDTNRLIDIEVRKIIDDSV